MPSNNIKCPSCGSEFDVQHVLSADMEQKIKIQYEKQHQQNLELVNAQKRKLEEDQKLFEEKRKRENELFQQKLQQEKLKMEADLQQQLRKSIAGDYEDLQFLIGKYGPDAAEVFFPFPKPLSARRKRGSGLSLISFTSQGVRRAASNVEPLTNKARLSTTLG